MLYQIHNGVVKFDEDTTILQNINFEIRDTEKIAVVGRNGCGKTTLLRVIAGELEIDKRSSDEDIYIAKAGNPVIGYLKQMAFRDDSVTLDQEIRSAFQPILDMQAQMERQLAELNRDDLSEEEAALLAKKYAASEERFSWMGGYDYEREYDIVLKQFGFPAETRGKKLSEFSGGQRTKIAFAKLLLSKPDILLLDEPTNHLDMSTVEWLEGYLKNYNRAVVIVSHDRMFLDKIADVVYEIEYGTTTRYPGNYSNFVERKKENWEKQQKDYVHQQKEIARLTALIEKFKHHPSKVSMAWSKLKQLEHMEKIEAPARYDLRTFHANCTPKRETGKEVLNVSHLQIGYDHVLSEATFTMKRGQKLAIIGANGTGKSTLLKTLTEQIPALGGEASFGFQVDVGYFDQQIAQYSSDKTVLEDMWDEFPDMTQTEVRTLLGSFLFTQDDVFKWVSVLSGGEKGRLALAKILKRQPNFLILDEPTNHMDIVGKETLEAMLKGFKGSVLFVSHDRYFVDQVADSLLIFDDVGGGQVTYYPYTYKEYQEDRAAKQAEEAARLAEMQMGGKGGKAGMSGGSFGSNAGSAGGASGAGKTGAASAKAPVYNPGKELSKLNRKLAKVEEQIAQCEEALENAKAELVNPEWASAYSKLSEIQATIDEKEAELEELMLEWAEIGEQIEELQQ